ncbi:TetR/AcrR family transcriptional regulator [Streptomonospora nanhaiensis]|uniref:TetR/AcrR family transcriptional repressor of mexJK operon n=1 Tax=Streptomonospora nanhaiensis TaxID=1323731 RepID=A0A853BJX6_9ACTN|nr:TetR/AcrR family transcriptional regulator [Streptomonospora nanhaiensis]MBV2362973.1 TetR/AcrR family transcriptional regulator [Streptomonospora nanhaiensis]MBX9390171.1 TetR/AcrR family transcriptional regulator [Streptomonospora nanhaiensis]NYI95340.1 TetR/AcrR family transcriptional repressor of mexJK operon [Streptomonospora nanhaiensis]
MSEAGTDPKREQIRAAAGELFLERGYAGTSTAEVAKKAGVSKETLYSRYRGKDELLGDVLESYIARSLAAAAPAGELAAPATEEELRGLLTTFAERLLAQLTRPDYLALARMVIAERHRVPEVGERFRAAVPVRALTRVSDMLRAAEGAGVIALPDADPAAAARLFMGPLLIHLLMNHLLTDPDENRPLGRLDIPTHVDLFLAAVRPSA